MYSKAKYSPANTIKAYKSDKSDKSDKSYEKPQKVEWKDKTPVQREKELKRKREKEAKKRAAAGEWSKEEDDNEPVVFQKMPWFNWADEVN